MGTFKHTFYTNITIFWVENGARIHKTVYLHSHTREECIQIHTHYPPLKVNQSATPQRAARQVSLTLILKSQIQDFKYILSEM